MWTEMAESGVLDQTALVFGQMNEPPGARTVSYTHLIRPLSLCMRLFGNVLGAVVVMALIKYLVPLVIPLPFSFYFDIFDGVIQAYVFVFLTSLYIKEAVETD